jgi:hypothetical protein
VKLEGIYSLSVTTVSSSTIAMAENGQIGQTNLAPPEDINPLHTPEFRQFAVIFGQKRSVSGIKFSVIRAS